MLPSVSPKVRLENALVTSMGQGSWSWNMSIWTRYLVSIFWSNIIQGYFQVRCTFQAAYECRTALRWSRTQSRRPPVWCGEGTKVKFVRLWESMHSLSSAWHIKISELHLVVKSIVWVIRPSILFWSMTWIHTDLKRRTIWSKGSLRPRIVFEMSQDSIGYRRIHRIPLVTSFDARWTTGKAKNRPPHPK